jgi:segregation and condensation protein B
VRRLLAAKPPRLSRPLLETLAIVAYRQPITRPEIEQLRGVDTGGVLDTLTERGLIKIAGRKDAPGRPIMYATTPEFLELFSLNDINSLPDLEEFRAIEGMIENAPERLAENAEEPARIGAPAANPTPPSGDAQSASGEGERLEVSTAANVAKESPAQSEEPAPASQHDAPDDSERDE